MRVILRLDPIALERDLLDRVDASHPRDEPGRTLVLVPTTRLAAHLQRRLGERRPAWLGLQVVQLTGLTREILRRQSNDVPQVASDLLLEALLHRLAATLPRNPWIAFTRERPGAMRALHETLKDLREAGIEPPVVTECCPDSGLAELYGAYHEALESAERAGWTDRAGLAERATALAAAFAAEYRSIFVHGAYEWTGVNLDLLRELDRGRELTVFVPAQPGTRVSRFAESFAVDYLGCSLDDGGDAPSPREDGALRLDALFDEASRPEPAPEGRLSFAHAQGPSAEVKLALREALRAVANGCPPTEIVLTARSLAPYAAAMEELFEAEGIAWTSSLATPLRGRPVVREFLLLLRLVAEEFPRGPTVSLLRSPFIDWSVLPGEEPSAPCADRADRWSREAGLIGGIEDWTHELPRWAGTPETHPDPSEEARRRAHEQAEQDRAVAERIASCVAALNGAVDTAPRRWTAHADGMRRLFETVFRGPIDEAAARGREKLIGLLDEMARLETWVGDTDEVTFERMRAWLEQAVDRSEWELHPRDDGGIRVLDAMQLRGMTFRRVHLLGMNSGLFPRSPREDPVLADGARREIARRSARPLRPKLEAAEEERLLLAILVGSASDAVHVSWQRADQAGKAQTSSLALRELARLRYGAPDLSRLHRDARHLRSHPEQQLRDLLEAPGLLSPRDEMLLTTLGSCGASQADALGERYAKLRPGLTMLRATESWDFTGPEFDARIGSLPAGAAPSVSELETLGRCPLQFFFNRVLRVEELPEEPSPVSIPTRELGLAVHSLLEQVYAELLEEGLFEPHRSVDLVGRALELLERKRGSLLGDAGRHAARRLPVLWDQQEQSWMSALVRAVRADLARVEKEGLRLVGVEERRRETLDLGRGFRLEISARFDRRFEGEEGAIVGDYKTSKNLSDRVKPADMLKGLQLQVPLYQELAGPGSVVEILGIHPDLEEDEIREVFAGFRDHAQKESFRDTVRVLLGLRSTGVFPFRANRHCDWCDYAAACRRHHPPTADREARAKDAAAYRELNGKSTRNLGRRSIEDSDA